MLMSFWGVQALYQSFGGSLLGAVGKLLQICAQTASQNPVMARLQPVCLKVVVSCMRVLGNAMGEEALGALISHVLSSCSAISKAEVRR